LREHLDCALQHRDLACSIPTSTENNRQPIIWVIAMETIPNVRLITFDGVVDESLRLKIHSK